MTRQSPRLRILLRRPNPRLTSAFIPLLGSSGMLPRMRAPALALGADRYLEKGEPLDVIRDTVREVALAA